MVEDPKKNAKRLVLLVWVLVAFFTSTFRTTTCGSK